MWNLFRRKVDRDFPKPKWAPIQALDSVDLTGKRNDGGVDLIIVASQPLDDSTEVLDSIRQKVETYLTIIDLDEFQAEMEYPPRDMTAIIIACEFPIHPSAQAVIEACKELAGTRGVRLEMQ